jgi:Calcineurin-like phosphoesterase
MATLIIFLSDIHIKQEDDAILARAKNIVDASFGDFSDEVSECHLVVTGDIAQSGLATEYNLASRFLSEIAESVTRRINRKPVVALCPGNHDCDFSGDLSVRNMILDGVTVGSRIELGVSKFLASPLLSYFEFVKTETDGDTAEDKWITRYHSTGKPSIRYTALNTALTSGLPERQGRLLFNLASAQDLNCSDADLSIFLLHQPLNWLQADCARAVGDIISTRADIALLGHEHKDRGVLVTGLYDESNVTFYHADVLFDRKGKLPSGFRSILVDAKGRTKSTRHVWRGSSYERDPNKSDSSWRECQNKETRRSNVSFSEEFIRWIDDIGANYAHRRKSHLTLSDIFVWPNLRPTIREKNSQTLLLDSDEISASKFFDGPTDYGLVVIRGDEQYGKTTLAKRWLAKLRSNGSYPIYMSGSEIKSIKGPYIDEAIRRVAKAQYTSVEDFFQKLEPVQRIILLDDFDDLSFNAIGKSELLNRLKAHFGTIILFVGNTPGIDLWLESLVAESHFSKVSSFEIMQMNFQCRMRLIEKWLDIGNEYSLEREDIESMATRLGRLVTDTLGRNLVPSVPLFVLIILQRAESESELDTVIKNGSHGFLYESLITRALVEKVPSFTVDTAMTYLTSYARELYNHSVDALSLYDLERFHSSHCDFYELTYSFERIKTEFCAAGIWVEKGGAVSFAYPYLYFFFVARYLTHLEDAQRRAVVVIELIATIHTEVSANILLFLAHLSRDTAVLEMLLKHASKVFQGVTSFDAYDAESILAEFQETKVKEVFYESSRDQGLALAQGEEARTNPMELVSVDNGLTTLEDVNDQARQMNTAFRTLQVLGQVLRNHAGSLEKPQKREIARACTQLGLRALSATLSLLKLAAPEIIQGRVQAIIESEKDKSLWRKKEMELIKDSSSELRELVTNITVGTFVRIASAIGSEVLAPTLQYILYTDGNATDRLIGMAVKLEHFSGFPREEVLELAKKKPSSKDVVALTLARRFVMRRFYMYPDKAELKREVCGVLSIERKPFQAKEIGGSRR